GCEAALRLQPHRLQPRHTWKMHIGVKTNGLWWDPKTYPSVPFVFNLLMDPMEKMDLESHEWGYGRPATQAWSASSAAMRWSELETHPNRASTTRSDASWLLE